jgi:DNA-binding CsgD family transcriptional regulator
MAIFFDAERQIRLSASLIEQDLELSAREAEIAILLSSGFDVDQVARRLQISVHTVRTHLKSIFSKTGISSQSGLIRRILMGPAHLRVEPASEIDQQLK